MAPSTNIPTARISPNSTTILRVNPKAARVRMPIKKDPGMAIPTNPAVRRPSTATITTMTRTIALSTLFWRSVSISRMLSDLSWEKSTRTAFCKSTGQFFRSSSTTRRISSVVSIIFSPVRFDTSKATALLPPTLANPLGSLKVLRTSATSLTRTAASPSTTTGIFIISSTVSKMPGTFTEKRPLPVSWAPAATNRLLALITWVTVDASMP